MSNRKQYIDRDFHLIMECLEFLEDEMEYRMCSEVNTTLKSFHRELNQMQNMQSIKKTFESVEREFENFFEGPKGFTKLGEFIDKTHQRFNELNTTRADKLRKRFKSSRELPINENKGKLVKKISLN